jgi:2'-5' RNA ligase
MSELCTGEVEASPVNCFALVSYIPGPLGRILDDLRRDLEPKTLAPRAHVTLLPPRALGSGITPAAAQSFLDRVLAEAAAIEIDLGEIKIFPVTNVVYVSLDSGFLQLKRLHERLNSGPMIDAEPFHYHPHVTLVQGLTGSEAEHVRQKATERWDLYRGPRQFSTDAFSFVQANSAKRWTDLAEYILAPALR